MKNKIYLDYAATTPLEIRVFKAMLPYLRKDFGNPSSFHCFGQKTRLAVEQAREKIADFLGCSAEEIIFTASATEANNLALRSCLTGNVKQGHIITSQIEHHSVLEVCRALEKEGIEITYLPINKEGLIKISDLEKSLRPNTVLVSLIYANNEIGTIQPIVDIGRLLKKKNSNRKTKIYFHTDAVQAINYLDCRVDHLGVDFLVMSAHKIYGPKGVGALFVRQGTPINPLIFGGGQERGLRSGTENVAGIVGLGAAIEEVKNPQIKIQNIKIRQLRDKLIKGILNRIPEAKLNGSLTERLPNNLNFSFKGTEGEAIMMALDQKGIAVSTGSACSTRDLAPSHVLLALGLSEEEAHSSLRITLGKYTNQKEIEKFLKVLPPIIEKLRKISGYPFKKRDR